MSRRKNGLNINGVVLLDKPVGISSNRALQKVRGIFQAKKAGHTGSLDPFATGMLPICLGEASKTAAFMLAAGKKYRATARFGEATTTGDIEGEIIQNGLVPDVDEDALRKVLAGFVGDIEQVPPMYSALKHDGKPLYEYARAGIDIERPARPVTIHELELVSWQTPQLVFDVRCSKGTYIRTLGEDIAKALDSCAHLTGLRRFYVEPFENLEMITLEQLQYAREAGMLDQQLLAVDVGLPEWPMIELNEQQQSKFSNGNQFPYPAGSDGSVGIVGSTGLTGSIEPDLEGESSRKGGAIEVGPVRVYGQIGNLLGLAELSDTGIVHPTRVFNLNS